MPDDDPILCVCTGLGRKALLELIRRQGLRTPEAITAASGAGGGCSCCRPELETLLREATGTGTTPKP